MSSPPFPPPSSAVDFAGRYHGDSLDLELRGDGSGGYVGEAATPAGQRFELTGRAAADGTLRGTFTANGHPYPFTATLGGDGLAFDTGGTHYRLARPAAAAPPNPLDPPNPLGADAAASPPPGVRLPHRYAFPDGTGTIDLPAGWTCVAQTAASNPGGVEVNGPDGQRVLLSAYLIVQTPQSPQVQMYQQLAWRARQFGGPVPPSPLCLPFGDPVPTLCDLLPQLNVYARSAGQPTTAVDRVLSATPTECALPNGRAALASLAVTDTAPDGSAKHYRVDGQYLTALLPGGTAFTFQVGAEMRAKADTFDREGPTLLAVVNSVRLNTDRINEVNRRTNEQVAAAGQAANDRIVETGRRNMADQQARFEAGQAAHRDRQGMYDRHNRAAAERSRATSRPAADFAEMLSGQQKIVNTRTGEERHVDYGTSDGIVNGLNDAAGSKDEWVAVHRRDEQ